MTSTIVALIVAVVAGYLAYWVAIDIAHKRAAR